MKVLVIGSGGREHALCWKISQSTLVDEVFCAPGNDGMLEDATCIDIKPGDVEYLARFAKSNNIDLTVVGPEAPLVSGLVDVFRENGLKIFGPDRKAAILEGSKAFAKTVMQRYNIPTARFAIFDDPEQARTYVSNVPYKVVVKADGLAAGKGAIVTDGESEAYNAIDRIMVQREFGDAGDKVVIEERLGGQEASFIAISDGENILPMASSQDHKPVYDGDKGPNTGGMGAYSPTPVVDERVYAMVMEDVLYPLVRGMKEIGAPYRGVIYAGLMVDTRLPKVLEFNVRMGDPETQPLLMRLKSDIVPIMLDVASGGSIKNMVLDWDTRAGVCVVMASGGYPGSYEKGKEITGIEEAEKIDGVKVFCSGVERRGNTLLTSGGRVLGVTALGEDIRRAVEKAYDAVGKISFDAVHFRKDIGEKALKRMP